RIFIQACRGLAAIHALQIVHRDIKPSNIFLHHAEGLLIAKVCDFGVAKNSASEGTASDLTHTGGIIGSPHYMSPEQVQDSKRVDHRSDLWSLSMAMYEVLSGRKGWAGCSTVGELLVAVCTKDLPWLQTEAPWVSGDLAAVVHKNLVRDPAQRFQSALEMAEALEPFASPPEALCDLDTLVASEQLRATRAPAHRDLSTLSRTAPTAPPRPSSTRLIVGGALLAGLLAAGLGLVSQRSQPAPAAAAVASARGRLRVPPQASVWVQGAPRPNADGWVDLEAPPGDAISVRLAHLDQRLDRTVTLTSKGQVIPDELVLPASPAPSAAPPVAPPTASAEPPAAPSAAPSARPRTSPRSATPATAAPTVTAAPTATATAAPTATLQLQKTW
nr:serine/threonine protein kinase [Polyangiaceae bacterium]